MAFDVQEVHVYDGTSFRVMEGVFGRGVVDGAGFRVLAGSPAEQRLRVPVLRLDPVQRLMETQTFRLLQPVQVLMRCRPKTTFLLPLPMLNRGGQQELARNVLRLRRLLLYPGQTLVFVFKLSRGSILGWGVNQRCLDSASLVRVFGMRAGYCYFEIDLNGCAV